MAVLSAHLACLRLASPPDQLSHTNNTGKPSPVAKQRGAIEQIHRTARRPSFSFRPDILNCTVALMLWFALPLTVIAEAPSTELLIVEEKGCVYCAKFNREIAVAYPKTREGRIAPLRRLDLHEAWPEPLAHIERPGFTPTFILLYKNQEIGRLVGYNGDEYFWFLLGELLQKIDQTTASESGSGSEPDEP